MTNTLDPEVYCQANEHPLWNQSYYFTFYDPATTIGCFIRVGVLENKQEVNSWMIFFKDGLPLYTRVNMNLPYTSQRLAGGMEVAGMTLQAIESQAKALVSFTDRDFSFELDFNAIHPMHDSIAMSQDSESTFAKNIATAHLEGPCSVTGKVTTRDGKTTLIDGGRGFRDIAVGARDWDGLKHYRLAWPLFDNDMAAVCVHGMSVAGDHAYMKMAHDGVDWRKVKTVDDTIDYDDNLFMKKVGWHIVDENDKSYRFVGRPLFSWHFPVDTFICTETMMEYQLEDGTLGYGLGECGFRLPWDFAVKPAR